MHQQDEHRYDDMLLLPHHVSPRRKPMPLADRAAQFSPFAALTGYDAAIRETARLTDDFVELSEDAKALLNEKLMLLKETIHTHPEATVTYFQEDGRKSGGAYVTVTGHVHRVDEYSRTLQLDDGTTISIELISELTSKLFRFMDE